jgi:hypothetical protein
MHPSPKLYVVIVCYEYGTKYLSFYYFNTREYFWSPKMWGLCTKSYVISQQFTQYGWKYPQINADSLHISHCIISNPKCWSTEPKQQRMRHYPNTFVVHYIMLTIKDDWVSQECWYTCCVTSLHVVCVDCIVSFTLKTCNYAQIIGGT